MHATRAAVEEASLLAAAPLFFLPRSCRKLKLHDDEAVGAGIVKRALEEPARQIAHNAGFEGAVVIGKIRDPRTKTCAVQQRDDCWRYATVSA